VLSARSCTCPNGPELARCHQKFSFNQVRQLRGEWLTCPDPESIEASFETSSNGKKRPVSLGNEVVEYTLPRELNYPFGAYEFALPDTFDSMLYDAMSHCVEYEKDDNGSLSREMTPTR